MISYTRSEYTLPSPLDVTIMIPNLAQEKSKHLQSIQVSFQFLGVGLPFQIAAHSCDFRAHFLHIYYMTIAISYSRLYFAHFRYLPFAPCHDSVNSFVLTWSPIIKIQAEGQLSFDLIGRIQSVHLSSSSAYACIHHSDCHVEQPGILNLRKLWTCSISEDNLHIISWYIVDRVSPSPHRLWHRCSLDFYTGHTYYESFLRTRYSASALTSFPLSQLIVIDTKGTIFTYLVYVSAHTWVA